MAMNQKLYDALLDRFGDVIIAHEGESLQASYDYNHAEKRTDMTVLSPGEEYRVSCLFCADTRNRLYINHLWGVFNPRTNNFNLHLAHCFNTDGLPQDQGCMEAPLRRQQLEDMIYRYISRDMRRALQIIPGKSGDTHELRPAILPGDCISIDRLAEDHPAVNYLLSKGYDPEYLAKEYSISFCQRSLQEYASAQGRIVIPIKMRGMLVGWQCRYPADLDWRTSRITKYYNLPAMPKRQMLYNYDRARQSRLLVLVEGPPDVWSTGPWAVALMGKSLTPSHMQMITSNWRNGAVVVMLDPDASEESQKMCQQLNPYFAGKLVEVSLPDDTDPGSFSRETVWGYINEAAQIQDVNLRKFF